MRKINVEATDENVLNSIRCDKLRRTDDVVDFIQILETIDYNAFIALDGAWGDGKTFLVRQIEMTLGFHNKKFYNREITEEERTAFSINKALGEMELDNTYLPVYFNAWQYDDNTDPLMALILILVKSCQKYLVPKVNSKSLGSKITALLSAVSLSVKNIEVSLDTKSVYEAWSRDDILSSVKTMDEIRECVKEILNDIIAEKAQKLVIFVDELDRCRPSFAIEMLERIKHYYDDERIIFVASVNKAQLVNTISKYYGNGFNASGYLNKFFDINIQLPPVNPAAYFSELGITVNSNNRMIEIANELQKSYTLSLRDSAIYYQKIDAIIEKCEKEIGDSYVALTMSVLIPIICILDIVNVIDKEAVIDGKGFAILKEIIDKNVSLQDAMLCFAGKFDRTNENIETGLCFFEGIYNYAFGDGREEERRMWKIDIRKDFKKKCLCICNVVSN